MTTLRKLPTMAPKSPAISNTGRDEVIMVEKFLLELGGQRAAVIYRYL
jgi:hypothetical protein